MQSWQIKVEFGSQPRERTCYKSGFVILGTGVDVYYFPTASLHSKLTAKAPENGWLEEFSFLGLGLFVRWQTFSFRDVNHDHCQGFLATYSHENLKGPNASFSPLK